MALPDLDGRTAVITGASRGIGAGLAREFAARGMNLGLCSRSDPALPDGDRVLAACLDVVDEAALEGFAADVAARFGSIDVWINNAGLLEPIAPLRNVEAKAFRAHIDVNLTGVFLGTRWYARHVRAREGEGVLINVSSGAAWSAYAGWGAYCAGKAAVERLTEVAQLEEADAGLRAYAVAPGVVDTQMQARIRSSSQEDFPMVERFHELKAADGFNTLGFVAEHFLKIAFDPDGRPEEVAVRLPDEKS